MKKTYLKKNTLRSAIPGVMICTFVFGNAWSGDVPLSSTAVTDTTGAVTKNTDLVVVTSQTLTTAANGVAIITLTNSRIVAGTTVRADLVDYSGTMGTNGIPTVSIDAIDTAAHTAVINIANAGGAALAGICKVLVQVVTLVNNV